MSSRGTLLEMYARVRKVHDEIHNQLADVEASIKQMDPAMIIDAVFALKKINELVDDTRKQINKKIGLAEKLGCVLTVAASENHLCGRWATGTANSVEQPGVPDADKNPEEYEALLTMLGVPPDVISARTVRPSFDAIGDLMSALAENGKPVPPELKSARMIPRYSITARSRFKEGMDGILRHESGKYNSEDVIFEVDDWPKNNDVY